MTIAIRALRDDERGWANDRYRAIQFAISPPDAVALVAEQGGVRVGLGRLVALEPGVRELGGIWTDEAARGRGAARAMVEALIALDDGAAGPLWCIPFAHLTPFYASFGFARRERPWPAAIAAKVADVEAHGLPPIHVLLCAR